MDYRVEKIAEKTWLIEEYDGTVSVYMYLLAGEKEAALIDTGLGLIPLRDIVSGLTNLPVKVLLTHGHIDHIGGVGAFRNTYLHEADKAAYEFHAKEYRKRFGAYDIPEIRQEVCTFKNGRCFDLGGRNIRAIHTPGHSLGSVCFLDENNRWLFAGDTCCKAHVLLNLEYSASVETYAESIQALLDQKEIYECIWPGHHTYPVETKVPKQFLEAAVGLLDSRYQGEPADALGEGTKLLSYKDIGIAYRDEGLRN